MIPGSVELLLRVNAAGYEWAGVDGSLRAGLELPIDPMDLEPPWLIPILRTYETGTQVIRYHAERVDRPDRQAWRAFVALAEWLDDDVAFRDRALQFAWGYGSLGTPVILAERSGESESGTAERWVVRSPMVRGESLARWRHEVQVFSDLATVWDLIRARDAARLEQAIEWDFDLCEAWYRPAKDRASYLIAKKESQPARWNTIRESETNPVATANVFLRTQIEQRLPKSVPGNPPPNWSYEPRTLLEAMAIEFHWAVKSAGNYQQCEICESWFLARGDAMTCSPKCRVAKSRRAKKSQRSSS